MPPEMLFWRSLLFNQKRLGTYTNYFSQKEKLSSFQKKNLSSSHLLSWSFNLKIPVEIPFVLGYKNDPTRTRLCYNWQRLQELLTEARVIDRIEAKPSQPFCFYNQGTLSWGPGWRSMVFVTRQIKKWGNSCAKASGTWKIIDCNSQSQIF